MEKLKTFYRKYLKNYLVLLIVVAIGMDIAIETLARHSLIESLKFIFMNPIVSLCNIRHDVDGGRHSKRRDTG